MTYSLAIVEDGLLDLTRFKTPNPWNTFFAKTALGVKTWDIYNDVIGAFGGTINQIFSIGGDEDLGVGKAKRPTDSSLSLSYKVLSRSREEARPTR